MWEQGTVERTSSLTYYENMAKKWIKEDYSTAVAYAITIMKIACNGCTVVLVLVFCHVSIVDQTSFIPARSNTLYSANPYT